MFETFHINWGQPLKAVDSRKKNDIKISPRSSLRNHDRQVRKKSELKYPLKNVRWAFFPPKSGHCARPLHMCVCVCSGLLWFTHLPPILLLSPSSSMEPLAAAPHTSIVPDSLKFERRLGAHTHRKTLDAPSTRCIHTHAHTHTSTHIHRWWEKSAQLIVGVGIEFRIDEIQDAGSRQSRQMFYFLDAASSRISVGLFRSSHTLDWSSRSLVKEKTVFYIDTGLHCSGFIFSAIKHRTQVSCRLVEKSSRFLNDRGRLSLRSTEVGIYIHFTIFPSSFRRLFPHRDEQVERGKEKKTPDSLFLFTISISISRLIWNKKTAIKEK